MASTRNINSRGNYKMENDEHMKNQMYNSYKHSPFGVSYDTSIPSIGITPSRLPRSALSNNYTDIESMLRGIGSTNLVDKSFEVTPQLKDIHTTSFFERIPIIMPATLSIEPHQRPKY